MFKSTFSKYMTAFILIILISFAMLSGIITSMIRTYSTEQKETQLVSTSTVISSYLNGDRVEQIEAPGRLDMIKNMITPMINNDNALDIIVTSSNGRILLSSVGASAIGDEIRKPIISSALGTVDLSLFKEKEYEGGGYLYHRGTVDDYLSERSILCACPVIHPDGRTTIGYVISLYSIEEDDNFIKITRRALINSSAWVMLAAVIAVYFITERIVHPLRNMKSAVKKFGKGDFSTRVTVYGSDEVSELALAVNNMAESLDNYDDMRNNFMSNVSHDLRSPMTSISGFIDGIMSGAIPEEKQEHYLRIISSEVHRLSRLVSQLLDVSRLESGDRKMNFSTFDVAEVARIVLISFESKIEEKRLDVEFDSDDEVFVVADKDAIHQVLYNLCHNAIKFANEGGKFRISISSMDSKRIKVSVYDEGQSISKSDSKMVFERFYKTDESRGLDKSGVGLGLYISKTIIDAHDEEINVESVDGVGTEFWFTLKTAKGE